MYSTLKTEIVGGDLGAGARLRESELAERFRVSRTPVRAALQRLQAEGLVIDKPGAGLVVATYTTQEVMDTYDVHEALEALTARLAAERASTSDILHLEAILNATGEALASSDHGRAVLLNSRFEKAFYDLPRNGPLRKTIEEIDVSLARMAPRSTMSAERLADRLKEHRAIVAAVRNRDSSRAEHEAREHVTRARDARIATMSLQAAEANRGDEGQP